jgi:hypothetical protein
MQVHPGTTLLVGLGCTKKKFKLLGKLKYLDKLHFFVMLNGSLQIPNIGIFHGSSLAVVNMAPNTQIRRNFFDMACTGSHIGIGE